MCQSLGIKCNKFVSDAEEADADGIQNQTQEP